MVMTDVRSEVFCRDLPHIPDKLGANTTFLA